MALVLVAPVAAKRPQGLRVEPAVVHVGDTFTVTAEAPRYPDGTAKVNWCNPGCLVSLAAHWSDGIGSATLDARFPGTHRIWFVGLGDDGRLFRTSEIAFEVLP